MRFFSRRSGLIVPSVLIISAVCLRFVVEGSGQTSTVSDPDQTQTATRTLIEKGAYAEAITLLRRELSRKDIELPERLQLSHVLNYLLLYTNDIEGAIENARISARLALDEGFSTGAQAFRNEIALLEAYRKGNAFRASHDINSSNDQFSEAYRLATLLKSPPYQLRIAAVWSLNYFNSVSDPGRHLDLSLRALNLAISLRYNVEASKAAKKIGTYYALNNEYSKALSYYLKALNVFENDRNYKDVSVCLNLNNISGIYISLGDYAKALDYLQEAVARMPEGTTGIFKASLFVNLGNIFAGLARRFSSQPSQKAALECYSLYLGLKDDQESGRVRLEALAGTADVYLGQGRLDEAHQILTSILEEARQSKNEPLALGRILSLLGDWSIRSKDIPAAEKYFNETRHIGQQARNLLLTLRADFGLGCCAEARGDPDQAIEFYDLALQSVREGLSDIVSDFHRAEFMGRGRGPFQALMRLYLERARGEAGNVYARELFRLTESERSRSLLEFQARLAGTQLPSERAPENPERAKLNAERFQLFKKLSLGNMRPEERERMDARIIQIDDHLDTLVFDQYRTGGEPTPSPFAPFQAHVLDGRTAVLEYLLGDTRSALFCITRDAFHLIELPPAREIEENLTGFLSFVEDPSLAAAKGLPAAQRLYETLLSRTEPLLPAEIDRLVIVPDGILFRLPFEALVMKDSGTKAPVYISDRFTISYAPCAASLHPESSKSQAVYSKAALVFGASEYLPKGNKEGLASFSPGSILNEIYGRRGFTLDPLPYVEKEVADLERRFGPADIEAFTGPAATESALKGLDLRAYRLIHLACHAFSDDSFPMRSALVLSPEAEEQEDGYLQVSEIYGLRTNADLIVLSACQTGRGKVFMNEGNLGLPRVFFLTGARSVLSTLWPVNDRSSSTFMRYFYDAYFRGEGKAAALRMAKGAMRKSRYSHPFYWAGYVLTGEY